MPGNRILPALLLAALTGGCATTHDCDLAVERARSAAEDGTGWRELAGTVAQTCREPARQAWAEPLAARCDPQYAFQTGIEGLARPEGCPDIAFASAHETGAMIGAMERELEQIRIELADGRITPERRRDLIQRRIVIERDLPQLKGQARIEGFLPGAALPGD